MADAEPMATPAATAVRLLAAAILLVLVGLFTTLYGVYRAADAASSAKTAAVNAKAASIDNHRILERFDDCTTPGPDTPHAGPGGRTTTGHECYDRGHADTATAVGSINCVTILTSIANALLPDLPECAATRAALVKAGVPLP